MKGPTSRPDSETTEILETDQDLDFYEFEDEDYLAEPVSQSEPAEETSLARPENDR